jgi:hypothetical protein
VLSNEKVLSSLPKEASAERIPFIEAKMHVPISLFG